MRADSIILAELARRSPAEIKAQRELCADAIEYVEGEGRDASEQRHMLALLDMARPMGGRVTADANNDGVDRVRSNGSGTGRASVLYASEKQLAFIARLIDEKDVTGIKIPADLTTLSRKAASPLIDRLMNAPRKPVEVTDIAVTPTAGPDATEAQIRFLSSLITRKMTGQQRDDMLAACSPAMGKRGASSLIDALNNMEDAPREAVAATEAPELAPGAYRIEGRVIRVYLGRQSGRMLASELVDITATDRDDAWRYLGAACRFVPAGSALMTADECEALNVPGADHGWCCSCGRFLTDANSVTRGIGPVCRAKQG